MSRSSLQEALDQWLPTVARWIGLVAIIVLLVLLSFGVTAVVPGFVPAAGLMLYKSVRGASSVDPPEE